MGYSYNRSAASLRTDRTNIIGVGFHDITNPYFAELLAAIEETAGRHDRSILLGTYAENLDKQARVLGILAGSTSRRHDPLLDRRQRGEPLAAGRRRRSGRTALARDRGSGSRLRRVRRLGMARHRRWSISSASAIVASRSSAREGKHFDGAQPLCGLPRVACSRRIAFDPALVHFDYGTREAGLKASRTCSLPAIRRRRPCA